MYDFQTECVNGKVVDKGIQYESSFRMYGKTPIRRKTPHYLIVVEIKDENGEKTDVRTFEDRELYNILFIGDEVQMEKEIKYQKSTGELKGVSYTIIDLFDNTYPATVSTADR